MAPLKRPRGRPAKNPVKPVVTQEDMEDTIEALGRVDSFEPQTVIERPPMRSPLREEDPRAAAARRAAEIRGHLGGLDEGTDEFSAPPPPDGWTYEWKRKTVMGQEDPAYQIHLARVGWEPVPTKRHPEMMPHNGSHPVIERKGMVLMQRPAVITEEAREIELRRARGQVRAKEEQLSSAPDGQFERNHPQARPKISKGYEPVPVPKD
jgi:hypothetical protein